MPEITFTIIIKSDRAEEVKLALEAAIRMPMVKDPNNPGSYIPKFDNIKDLVKFWLSQQLRKAYIVGVNEIATQNAPKDTEFLV